MDTSSKNEMIFIKSSGAKRVTSRQIRFGQRRARICFSRSRLATMAHDRHFGGNIRGHRQFCCSLIQDTHTISHSQSSMISRSDGVASQSAPRGSAPSPPRPLRPMKISSWPVTILFHFSLTGATIITATVCVCMCVSGKEDHSIELDASSCRLFVAGHKGDHKCRRRKPPVS